MDRRRTFETSVKNTYASDYINNKKAKVKFAGTSNLARTVAAQGGMLPLRTPSGHLKPYQGTYGFSSTTLVQGAPPSSYCLNQSRSYSDYLDITKGKYLLTPPNPTLEKLQLNQVNAANQIYSGTYLKQNYIGVAETTIFNNGATGATGATGAVNRIIYNPLTNNSQHIIVDPNYDLFYNPTSCLINKNKVFLNNITLLQDNNSQTYIDRIMNNELLNGFCYPSKFQLDYKNSDCINANNDLQNI